MNDEVKHCPVLDQPSALPRFIVDCCAGCQNRRGDNSRALEEARSALLEIFERVPMDIVWMLEHKEDRARWMKAAGSSDRRVPPIIKSTTTPTPITDAVMDIECPLGTSQAYIQMRDHARQLERDLAASRAECARQHKLMTKADEEATAWAIKEGNASAECARLKMGLHQIIGMCEGADFCACGRPTGIPAVIHSARAALSAPAEPKKEGAV